MENNIIINNNTCINCGLCAEVCPNKIIKSNKEVTSCIEDRVSLCFKCGQCMSICPVSAICIKELSYERDFCNIVDTGDYEESFFNLISSRRSIRNFKDIPIPKDMLEKVVKSIAYAPIGFPPVKTEIIVVQNPEDMKRAFPHMVDLYNFLYSAYCKPMKRFFIKKEVGNQKFRQMESHLMPMLKVQLPGLKNGSVDTITRNAPAMILFHADVQGEDIKPDAYIAATYCILAAHAVGLGGSIMDIIPPAINKKKELREIFKIPVNHEVIASVILGYPKYSYRRGIVKSLKSVRWV